MNTTEGPCPLRLLTAIDLARLLGLSLRQVWRLRAAGVVPPPVRIGRRGVRWRQGDITTYLSRL
jgi:predicted DNA-binding transcriptional regulator AlpA